jgi:hypothetical protein
VSEAISVVHQEGEEQGPQNHVVEETDTVHVSDDYTTALISAQTWAYYLGTSVGGVHHYGPSYAGDGEADIASYWQTKALDFADQYPQLMSTWKTVYHVWLDYVDLDQIAIQVGVSTDNGRTWKQADAIIGNGSRTMKTKRFDFRGVTGRFFVVRVSHSSNDKLFQLVRLKVEFASHAEQFSTG